jgi:dihydropteroate synthase
MNPLVFRHITFDLSRPYLVGILNVTPDSFSDGGKFVSTEQALAHAAQMEAEGADWIDVGGESTRPRAEKVTASDEARRVIPVVEALAKRTKLPISIDTYKAEVADAALAAGAEIVNDVSGGRLDPDLLAVVARHGAAVVLGHLRGEPQTMQESIRFTDVFAEVAAELGERVEVARAVGIERIVVDPGIGFGKRAPHNVELIRRAGELERALGRPVMIGASRKSFLGELTGIKQATDRLVPSVVAAVMASRAGARFLRVHDVGATRQALRIAEALSGPLPEGPGPLREAQGGSRRRSR